MSQKSSNFVQETREREAWISSLPEGEEERKALLATAALARGALHAIPVPEDAEERSRAEAVAHMQELLLARSRQSEVRAPWYLRLGSIMRYVFTLGRRR
jgi:hypothetical protein